MTGVVEIASANSQQAAGTEEIAAASKMYEQSERLAATVSYFSVQGRARTPRVPAPNVAASAEMNEEPRYEARYGT